jgi:hypothetical protein
MEDVIATAVRVLAAVAIVALASGALMKSRALLVFGATLGASLVLTWVLNLLGLPVGIFFGFLGTGFLFRPRERKPDPPVTDLYEQ